MADNLGNQGGFEGIASAAKSFQSSTKVFKTSVGEWTFGVVSLGKVMKPATDGIKNFGGAIFSMTGVLKGLGDAFTKAKLVDVIADLTISMYDTRKTLQRSYGISGKENARIANVIREQSKSTNSFGVRMRENLDSYQALAAEYRSLSFGDDLIGLSSLIGAAFGIDGDDASKIIYSLDKFSNLSPKGIEGYMNTILNAAEGAELSVAAVASNMAESAKYMNRFDTSSKKGRDNFQKMLIYSTKMGTTVGVMISNMDQYRTIPGAIEGSVTASLAGLNIGAGQLLSAARGGDPAMLTQTIVRHLKGFSNSQTGQLSQVGIDIANMLGPMIGKDSEDLQKMLLREYYQNTDAFKSMEDMRKKAEGQQHLLAKLENVLYSMLKILEPAMSAIVRGAEFVSEHTTILKAILTTTALGWVFFKSWALADKVKGIWGVAQTGAAGGPGMDYIQKKSLGLRGRGFAGAKDLSSGTKVKRFLSGWRHYDEDFDYESKSMRETSSGGGRRGRSSGGGRSRAPSRIPQGGQDSIGAMNASAKQMAASAIPMLAFAASTLMLAKAFDMFGEVNWKEAKHGLWVIGAFTVAMLGLGTLVTVGWAPMLAMGGMMLAFGGSIMLLAGAMNMMIKPIETMANVNLFDIGKGLVALSAGLGAMMLLGASGPLGWVALGIGTLAASKSINAIGEVALKHASNIETLSYAMERLATSMERIQAVEAAGGSIKINSSPVDSLERSIMSLIGDGSKSNKEIIENHITVELDSMVVSRAQARSVGTRGTR